MKTSRQSLDLIASAITGGGVAVDEYVKKAGDTMTGKLNFDQENRKTRIGSTTNGLLLECSFPDGSIATQVVVKDNGQMVLADGGGDYRIFHEGNDGAGSGLNADLLDGYHADHFMHTAMVDVDNTVRTIAANTITQLNELNISEAPAGTYEISFSGYYSFPTTRHSYYIGLTSNTHTVKIPQIVHEPKDSNNINPEYDRFIFNHGGGAINFAVYLEHDHNEDLTVHYSDIKLTRLA